MTDTMMALKRYGLTKSDFHIVQLQNAKTSTLGITKVNYNGKTYQYGGICGISNSVAKNTKWQLENAIDSFLSEVGAIR